MGSACSQLPASHLQRGSQCTGEGVGRGCGGRDQVPGICWEQNENSLELGYIMTNHNWSSLDLIGACSVLGSVLGSVLTASQTLLLLNSPGLSGECHYCLSVAAQKRSLREAE